MLMYGKALKVLYYRRQRGKLRLIQAVDPRL